MSETFIQFDPRLPRRYDVRLALMTSTPEEFTIAYQLHDRLREARKLLCDEASDQADYDFLKKLGLVE